MSPNTPAKKKLDQKHLDAAEAALDHVTDNAVPTRHSDHPTTQLHAPSNEHQSHTWMRSLFPYGSIEEFESAWHLGNYVLDRQTGEKSFEEMSIYVRV
jgi:phosphatidylserine decarboxylase